MFVGRFSAQMSVGLLVLFGGGLRFRLLPPTEPMMDAHVRWLRRRIIRRGVAAVAAVAFGASTLASATAVAMGAEVLAAAPWGLLAGQVAALAVVAWSMFTNPLDLRYLQGHLQEPRTFHRTAPDGADEALTARMVAHRFEEVATVWDATGSEPHAVFDVFATPRETVTAVHGRATGNVSLYSRLDDGRILVTDSVVTVPHSSLVLNHCPAEAESNALITSHLAMLETLGAAGIAVRADDPSIVVESLRIEHEAFRFLGPALGCFFNPTGGRYRMRLLVTPAADDLLELALSTPTTTLVAG